MKIVIHVEGGTVQAVYSDDPAVQVKIVDSDDLSGEGLLQAERDAVLDEATESLEEVDTE